MNIGLMFLGFFVALFSAGIGIGGGALFVSLLISMFGFDFNKATSTSLATIIPISFIASVSHLFILSDFLNIRYYIIFIPICVFGTILGGKFIHKRQSKSLKFIFSVFLFVISLKILKIYDFPSLFYLSLYEILFANKFLVICLFGIIVGFLSINLGIGCGLLIVPFYIIVINFDVHEAISLSVTTMFFITFSATIINSKLKKLDINPLKSLLIPALAGAVSGAIISKQLPSHILKQIFGIFLFIIACKYLIQQTFELFINYTAINFTIKFKNLKRLKCQQKIYTKNYEKP
ncbi:putative membrane transporter protein [Candidatus Magnetomoraceae bacterium gMMP-15]